MFSATSLRMRRSLEINLLICLLQHKNSFCPKRIMVYMIWHAQIVSETERSKYVIKLTFTLNAFESSYFTVDKHNFNLIIRCLISHAMLSRLIQFNSFWRLKWMPLSRHSHGIKTFSRISFEIQIEWNPKWHALFFKQTSLVTLSLEIRLEICAYFIHNRSLFYIWNITLIEWHFVP